MAECSLANEFPTLRLGEGAEFEGEGSPAVTKALVQSAVASLGADQRAPISHRRSPQHLPGRGG